MPQTTFFLADLAEMKSQAYLRAKGGGLKIGNDISLANYIEHKIVDEHYSPAAVVGELTAMPTHHGNEAAMSVRTD